MNTIVEPRSHEDTKVLEPVLRFTDFSDSWNFVYLSELMIFKNGINASKEQYGFGKKFINVLDIIENDYITHDRIIGSVDISDKEFGKNEVSYGDVLFQRSSETREEVGQSNVYLDAEQPATFGGFVIRGKKIGDYNPSFMNLALKTPFVRKEITSRSGGSTRYNIGQESLSKVQVCLPAMKEQQKIADFLSSMDKKIEQLTEKHRLLTEYKKGVMQQIFTQQIRFKDNQGNDYPEWEEKRLGDLIDNRGGTALESLVSENGTHKFISIGNYSTDGKYIDNGQRISPEGKAKQKLLNKNDLVMVLNDKTASGDLIGSSILIDEDDAYIYNQRSERIICNGNFVSEFAWHLFNSKEFRKKVVSLSQGGTQIYINFSAIKSILIGLPEIEEQQKIANFLTKIDQKIDQAWSTLEQTKAFKKGLLQKMFV